MERLTTSIISLFVALSFVNAKANDVPRQNENIIANYSLDEDDTLRCGIYAALDYCQERQQKVVHFNTIDPKADQYPELNPYLYCAGNPIKYVDPSGEDVWEMDENGHVLNKIKDQTKDAFRMNGKEIAFEYGTVVADNVSNSIFETTFLFQNEIAGKNAFKFFADNSNVEYALIVTNTKSCVTTNHWKGSVIPGWAMALMNSFYVNVLEEYHNHPSNSGPSGFSDKSNGRDRESVTYMETIYGKKVSWYVYLPKPQIFIEYIPEMIMPYILHPQELNFDPIDITEKSPSKYFLLRYILEKSKIQSSK